MDKRLLPLVLSFLLVSCAPAAPSQEGSSSSSVAALEGAAESRTIDVTAENWKFSPALIRVKKGEKVKVAVEGLSGVHGFAVPGMSISLAVEPDTTVSADLVTDNAGVYDFFCSIPCGSGHREMRGQIIVEE